MHRALRHADSVVRDFERQSLVGNAQLDKHARRLGMTRDIGQDFLKYPEYGGRQLVSRMSGLSRQFRPATDAQPLLKFLGLPSNRRDKTHVIEDLRSHAG